MTTNYELLKDTPVNTVILVWDCNEEYCIPRRFHSVDKETDLIYVFPSLKSSLTTDVRVDYECFKFITDETKNIDKFRDVEFGTPIIAENNVVNFNYVDKDTDNVHWFDNAMKPGCSLRADFPNIVENKKQNTCKKDISKQNTYKKDVSKLNEIDIYDVLVLYNVTCPATQHAIKKLLAAGQRGVKDRLQDLNESKDSIIRAIEIEAGK